MTLENTIQSFGNAFRRMESKSAIRKRYQDYPDFKLGKKSGVNGQIKRVEVILQALRDGSPEGLRDFAQNKNKVGWLSISGLTWEFELKLGDIPEYRHVHTGDLFHNEAVMDHFSAYLFGTQGTSILSYLFDEPNWGEINTDYFRELQGRASKVLEKARSIRLEIFGSDRIFKVTSNDGQLYIPDPAWELSADETLRLLREFQRATYNPSYCPRYDTDKIVAYHAQGMVLNRLHLFRNSGRVIKLHDLIDDGRIQQAFPNDDIDRAKTIYYNPLSEDRLRLIHETAYFVKESARLEEVEALGKEVIDIFQSVRKILRGIAKEKFEK